MFNFLAWLVSGVLAGAAASLLFRTDSRLGVLLNVVLGVAGALMATVVFVPLFGISTSEPNTFSLPSILIASAGAISLLAVVNLIRRAAKRDTSFSGRSRPRVISAVTRWENEGGAASPEQLEAIAARAAEPLRPATLTPGTGRNSPASKHTGEGHYKSEYRAVVTAFFPTRESGLLAREQLDALPHDASAQSVQWFEAPRAEQAPDDLQPAPAKSTLIVQLTDATRGAEIVRLLQEAGATLATFYPARSVVGAPRAI